MSENDDIIEASYQSTCAECHKAFVLETGEIVKGWEKVYIVSPGPLLCKRCKDSISAELNSGAKE